MKILIVDDNPVNLKLLRVVLEGEGYQVVQACDGAEALKVLQRETADLVISDILMPNMDGYGLCYELRHLDKFQTIPFIAYTSAYTSASDEKMAFDAGMDKYVRHPSPIRLLLDAIAECTADPKYRERRLTAFRTQGDVTKAYSETLVRKLEERNFSLEIAQAEITRINGDLEQRVRDRTAELEAANIELEAFTYSAAHDLRAPVRAIGGYSHLLLEDFGPQLNDDAEQYIKRIETLSLKMNGLIEELLKLSHVGHCELTRQRVDLSALAGNIVDDLRRAEPGREVRITIEPGIVAQGDKSLLTIALENLLSNAWKFTGKTRDPWIEFGHSVGSDQAVCYVRDNGAGFDMALANKMFDPFQRLHGQGDFPGTGLGLTIVRRIVTRHGGRVWADSVPNEGATFHLEL